MLTSMPHTTFIEWLAYFELKAEDEEKAMKKAQSKGSNTRSLI